MECLRQIGNVPTFAAKVRPAFSILHSLVWQTKMPCRERAPSGYYRHREIVPRDRETLSSFSYSPCISIFRSMYSRRTRTHITHPM